jgi:hypothetical protein
MPNINTGTGSITSSHSRSLSTRPRRSFRQPGALPFAGTHALSSARPTLTARQERLGWIPEQASRSKSRSAQQTSQQDRPHGPGRVNTSRLHLCLHLTTHPPPTESAATSPPPPLRPPSTSHRQIANMREVISLNGMLLFTPMLGPRAP